MGLTACRFGLVVSMGLLVASASRGDEAKEVTGDLKTIQGAWTYTNSGGQDERWEFEGDTLKSSVNGQSYVSKVTLDPKGKPEPTIDFKVKEAPDDTAGQTVRGIYSLDGDTLKVCIALPGQDSRPGEFKQAEGESILFTLKRAK